ncbi:cytochrome c biogenesis protein [Microbacterium endophyticum]|uniref:Cytochrome c biogenesis protein n=1 Tax=Microbacterium endophyticum TaxID=1526412 RepID=A0A7W4V5K3_9MICO|nr:cytochrome c biogenesis protein ResB [Microbacterium endophyticum]MBB2976685.1 cytochrome c biogenesis protein [Microbacterium endophyticum]NIK37646.1 cytochrome c biogenesis protein [Microbacterium endophyticum]
MSRSRSEADSEPLRPSDHIDGVAAPDDRSGGSDEITQPHLGFVGWMRWAWRQLTSMRTALVLLLLLAIAAVPGSIFPQRTADPNGVTQYFTDNPDVAPILDNLQLFDVYSSSWFSAIYILLFISLIGCVIPRTKHHWKALRSRPPRTPARLARLDDHIVSEVAIEGDADKSARDAVTLAASQLRTAGYRVERYDGRGSYSVSAERGYLRETGNLVFHVALIGVLIAVGVGGSFTYTGQRVIVEGTTFVNALTDYSSFNPGRFVNIDDVSRYSMTLDSFDVTYQEAGTSGAGQAGDFSANLTTQVPGQEASEGAVKVNHPLKIEGDSIYLLGNGYAPTITVADADGNVVYQDSVPFLPQDNNLTSLGVVKVADGLPEQVGLVGFFYPTAQTLESGALASIWPDLVYPTLTLNVYAGDLGIDDGTPRSVYTLDTGSMEKLTGTDTDTESIELMPGESAELPNGWGTVTFTNEAPEGADGYEQSVKRFASLSIHHDAAGPWVLLFAVLATLGLLVALFVPRRRMWVKATSTETGVRIEYAGLARGEDPTLAAAVAQMARKHGDALESGK